MSKDTRRSGNGNDRAERRKAQKARRKTPIQIERRDIVVNIWKRLGKAIHQKEINKAIQITCEELHNALLEGKIISLPSFGTFNQGVIEPHHMTHAGTKETMMTRRSIRIRFHAHQDFSQMIKDRRDYFSNKNK